nr:hypothetical protein Iba_chr12cCG1000 [Ipomoea batatas]GME17164.1 hypothetical protein Iba_scaffold18403CG0280 [Ipomoea batatas]
MAIGELLQPASNTTGPALIFTPFRFFLANNLFRFVLSLSRKFLKIVPFCFYALHRKLQFWCFLLGFPVADHYTIFPSPFLQF